MAKLAYRHRRSRGAAALEFALVTPLLLMLFGGLVGFGLMVWAQYQIGSLATQTVRSCIAQQQSLQGDPRTTLTNCAQLQFATLYNYESPNLCSQTPSVQATVPTLGAPLLSGRQAYLLMVQVRCQKNYLSLINVYTNTLTNQTLLAQSAMPFVP